MMITIICYSVLLLYAQLLLFIFTVRMPQSWVLSSLVQRAITTLFQRPAVRAQEEVDGTGASPCRLQAGSLCSCVSRNRSRRSGWRPSERSSLNPWPQRTMLVRYCGCTSHRVATSMFVWIIWVNGELCSARVCTWISTNDSPFACFCLSSI